MSHRLTLLFLLAGLSLNLVACQSQRRGDDDDSTDDDDDDDSSVAGADDDDTVMPPEDSLHGVYPESEVPLPQFEALNSDGAVRGPDDLRGHRTVMWFFPFAGTPT